jgi:ATP-dependent Zn protease
VGEMPIDEDPPSDLDLLTYHEAGHAAVAVAMGFRLRAVQIHPLIEVGVTRLAEGEQTTRLQQAIILLAEARAELVLNPSSSMRRLSALADECQLLEIIEERPSYRLEHLPQNYIDRLCSRMDDQLAACCERLVRERWPAMHRLAAELARRPKLTGEEAERVLAGEDQ